MAEVESNESKMLADGTDQEIPGKQAYAQGDVPNQNGLDVHNGGSGDGIAAPLNGLSEKNQQEKPVEDMETENTELDDKLLENGNVDKDDDNTQDSIQESVSAKSDDVPVTLSDSEALESGGNSDSPVVVNSDGSQDGENSSEAMEVDNKDDDSNIEINSSAPNSVLEVGENNSNRQSLVSEDSSRDSLDSNESMKSGDSSESRKKESLVDRVKGDDGDEFLITLNEDDGEKEKADTDKKTEKKGNTEQSQNKNIENDTEKSEKTAEADKEPSENKTGQVISNVELMPQIQAVIAPTVPAATTLLFPVSTQSIVVQGTVQNVRPEYQLVRQGNQVGYVTLVGGQHVFVPVSSPAAAAVQGALPKNQVMVNQLTTGQQQPQQKKTAQPAKTAEDLLPKSSWEMIELMKWELQNRVPDNYNWSVAFHNRKDETSSITSFLQELGSDVVKEQVYKDIIQIQTKKKEAGDLKNPEIESLDKMKTVYENTKKKVEHLQLETKDCPLCDYKTESGVVLNYHNDYPHFDPPWDSNKGWLLCARCDFKTKTPVQYIFHQKDIHNVKAKFLEKEQYFHCSLCPLSVSTKSKMEKHQQKCMKHFKLNANLQPYYHDVNFCMKTCFYKPRKPAPKPQPPPPKPVAVKTPVPTRQQGSVSISQPVIQQAQSVRTSDALRQRLPLVRNTVPTVQQTLQRLHQAQPPRPRLTPPTLQRAPVQQQQKPTRPVNKEMSGFEVCELCGGYVKDRQALRIHFYYAHKVEMPQAIFRRPTPPLTCDICKQHYWTTQGLTKHKSATRHYASERPSPTPGAKITPGAKVTPGGKVAAEQECFMCLKRFPNLFVHFERVHGMTMKDLVLVRKCIMCGLAASDYKSLEAHLVNAHGVLIRINDYLNDKNKTVRPPSVSASVISGGKNVGKINYCVFCQIQFPDNIQLTMHCIKIHAACKTCGMVVATSKHLEAHSCSKAHINRSCEICGVKVPSQEKYAAHLRSHVKPCQVKVENLTEEQIETAKSKIKREYKPAVISLDSDEDDSDVEVVETKPSKTKAVLESGKDVDLVDEKSMKKVDSKVDSNDNNGKSDQSEKSEKMEDEIDSKKELDDGNLGGKTSSDQRKDNAEETQNVKQEDCSEAITIKSDGHSNQLEESNSEATDKTEGEELKIEPVVGSETDKEVCADVHEMENANEGKIENNDVNLMTEEKLDEKLLENDDDSVASSESRKRKKSESDIDEDELLRDDTADVKRQKTTDKTEDMTENDKNVNEIAKTEADNCVQDVEMKDNDSDGDEKSEEI